MNHLPEGQCVCKNPRTRVIENQVRCCLCLKVIGKDSNKGTRSVGMRNSGVGKRRQNFVSPHRFARAEKFYAEQAKKKEKRKRAKKHRRHP